MNTPDLQEHDEHGVTLPTVGDCVANVGRLVVGGVGMVGPFVGLVEGLFVGRVGFLVGRFVGAGVGVQQLNI